MRISIVTPTLNSEKYIQETLLSIIKCSENQNIEHIVVDAGSIDNTKNIVDSVGISNWYDLEKSTMYEAIDYGFKKSTGELLCWINSDDILLPYTLNMWIKYFNKCKKTMIVTGGTYYIDNISKELYTYNWVTLNANFIESFKVLMLCQPSTCWRKEVYFNNGGFDLNYKITADRDFFIRMIRKYGIVRIPIELSKFRIHSESLSKIEKKIIFEENFKINQNLNAGPTSLKRFFFNLTGNIISKIINLNMIIWKFKNHKVSLFYSFNNNTKWAKFFLNKIN